MVGRDASTESQLAMMANSADRSNRPRMLVVVGLLVCVAGVLLLGVRGATFFGTRSLLDERQYERAAIQRYIELASEAQTGRVDLRETFPDNFQMADIIQRRADEVWGARAEDLVTVGVIQNRPAIFQGDPRLKTADVRCQLINPRTEEILGWIESVLAEGDEGGPLEGIFVSQIDISPRGPGEWAGTVIFRRYVYTD